MYTKSNKDTDKLILKLVQIISDYNKFPKWIIKTNCSDLFRWKFDKTIILGYNWVNSLKFSKQCAICLMAPLTNCCYRGIYTTNTTHRQKKKHIPPPKKKMSFSPNTISVIQTVSWWLVVTLRAIFGSFAVTKTVVLKTKRLTFFTEHRIKNK